MPVIRKLQKQLQQDLLALANAAYRAAVRLPAELREMPPRERKRWVKHVNHLVLLMPDGTSATVTMPTPLPVPLDFQHIDVSQCPQVARWATVTQQRRRAVEDYQITLARQAAKRAVSRQRLLTLP